MTETVHLQVPATMANLGPGFDCFGMAVTLHNRFRFERSETDALTFSSQGRADTFGLSGDPAQNIVFGALNLFYERLGKARPPIAVDVIADIPVARGLGSSSTAIVAALLAANEMSGHPLTRQDLLDLAVDIEGHPDNVAPALLGGVILYDSRPYVLPWPKDWGILAVVPPYPVLTEEARRALPGNYPLSDAVFNVRKASLLTLALLRGDAEALRLALQDRLHQPYRQRLIPEYEAVESLAWQNGAYGAIISGSGSTMAVFYPPNAEEALCQAIAAWSERQGAGLILHRLQPDHDGAAVLQQA